MERFIRKLRLLTRLTQHQFIDDRTAYLYGLTDEKMKIIRELGTVIAMNLQQTQLQIYQLQQQMTLTLDDPKSVKLQVKNINLIQKQLRAIKKEVNLAIKLINQQAAQTTPDSIVSVGLDLFGKRKLAGQLRQSTRRAIQSEKISARQPYMDVKDYIDQIILAGDRLKLQAEQFNENY